MFGPAFIHRRLKPLYDALSASGFRINTGGRQELRTSMDNWEAQWGIGRFQVELANGIEISIIDYFLAGDDPKWEIAFFRNDCSDWFPEANLREDEEGFTMWRFNLEDLASCMESFEALAVRFGK